MMSVDLSAMSNAGISPIDPLWMDCLRVRAPTNTGHEHWVAAGKPCLRQDCGHRRGNHIPSEDMECNECDCLGFVGLADPDDSVATQAIRSPSRSKRRRPESADAQQGLSSHTDRLALSRRCPDHDRGGR
jgi:hypothetical protein